MYSLPYMVFLDLSFLIIQKIGQKFPSCKHSKRYEHCEQVFAMLSAYAGDSLGSVPSKILFLNGNFNFLFT
jgi:hypothetical protein